ncbi:Uncharacterised protein [Candidatus Anstonella stagnisolia]|nr:Uncharacterised protein [Candidatus Anstonella stagnisolia]
MGVVETGNVAYTNYTGDITLARKGQKTKFAQAKNMDEELELMQKQKIQDGDCISTGRKSFITIAGHPKGGAFQFISVFPESELVLRTKNWEGAVKGEEQKGQGISKIEFAKGTFIVYPADAQLEIPLVEIKDINEDKGMQFKFILDIVQGATVVIPGSRMLVKSKAGGKPCETYPAYGSMGMTQLMVTTSGMYEKSMEVDERVAKLSSTALQIGMGIPAGLKYEEGSAEYALRKIKENKKKTEEAVKSAGEIDVEAMRKKGASEAQIELAKSMRASMKAASGSGAAFGINMLASMDFSKMKDMPGLTPEQKKQMEEAAPKFAQLQKQLSGAKLQQINAQAQLSEKYLQTAASDPVAKKRVNQAKAQMQEMIDSFSLPPYPKPDEKFRVK